MGTPANLRFKDTLSFKKLQGRFTVRVELSDRDQPERRSQLVLRKDPAHVPELKQVLTSASGEIDRHLVGTRIAPTSADQDDLVRPIRCCRPVAASGSGYCVRSTRAQRRNCGRSFV